MQKVSEVNPYTVFYYAFWVTFVSYSYVREFLLGLTLCFCFLFTYLPILESVC